MKWVNAKQELPKHNQEVLVRCRGIFNLAIYNQDEKKFELKDGSSYYVATDQVMWVGLIAPDQK
jgi:hypothetical protein